MTKENVITNKNAKITKPRFNYSNGTGVNHSIITGCSNRVEVVGTDASYDYIIYDSNNDILEYSDCGYGSTAKTLHDGLVSCFKNYEG